MLKHFELPGYSQNYDTGNAQCALSIQSSTDINWFMSRF